MTQSADRPKHFYKYKYIDEDKLDYSQRWLVYFEQFVSYR